MDIEKRKDVYFSIPDDTPIHKARRKQIMKQILELIQAGK